MLYPPPQPTQDGHTIAKEENNHFPHNDVMDTPTFLQSLDMPTSETGASLLDGLGSDGGAGLSEFGLSPNFGSFPEYTDPNGKDEAVHDVGAVNSMASPTLGSASALPNLLHGGIGQGLGNMNSALTKISPLLPLPQLSDPVINNLQIPSASVLSSYLQNGSTMGRNGPQLLTSGKKKKVPQASKQPPAFIQKMWSMVNDPENHTYIHWSDDGESFLVAHREEFMKSILPKYFKHNNFASFVRQLNMYGWHKVQDVTSGLLRDDRNPEEVLQFKNPLFMRGREDLLDSIVRNKSGANETEAADVNQLNLQLVINELELIKMNQLAIIEDMRRMRKDNQMLWNESFSARERHLKQTDTLEKIMKFLAVVYGNSAGKVFEVEDRYDQHFDHQVSPYTSSKNSSVSNPTPSAAATYPPHQPFQKPRLMLMNKAYQLTPEESKSLTASSRNVTNANSPSAPTNSEHASPTANGEQITELNPKGRNSTSSRKDSVASTGRDVIEEIARSSPDLSHGDANKVFQQIMNPDGSIASPNNYLSDFAQYFQNTPSMPNAPDKTQINDNIQGLEQNIYRQGQALLHVQDLLQQLTDRQNQQQEELQQHKQKQGLVSLTPNSGDEFNMDDFLSSNPLDTNSTDGKSPEKPPSKRHIEDAEDESTSTKKAKK